MAVTDNCANDIASEICSTASSGQDQRTLSKINEEFFSSQIHAFVRSVCTIGGATGREKPLDA
jgi:hypothetical protein